MDTDQLIRTLAADNATRTRSVGSMLALALAIAMPITVIAFFATLGFRSDIRSAMHNPFFDFKFLVTLSLAGALAGLFSAGLAATLYASQCNDDSPLFVITWYSLATALVTAVGAFAGSRFLRF